MECKRRKTPECNFRTQACQELWIAGLLLQLHYEDCHGLSTEEAKYDAGFAMGLKENEKTPLPFSTHSKLPLELSEGAYLERNKEFIGKTGEEIWADLMDRKYPKIDSSQNEVAP